MKKNTIKKLELDKSVISKFHTNAVKGGISGNTVGVTTTSVITITVATGTTTIGTRTW